MSTWNTAYQEQPRDWRNPGEGAFHFRDLKVAIKERENREHFWGDDEDSSSNWLGGYHREGSSRVAVTDGGTSARGGQVTATATKIGQVIVDTHAPVARQQAGVDLHTVATYDYKDLLEKKIRVVGAGFVDSSGAWSDPSDPTDNEVYTIFDYDQLVDIIQDQVIRGIKEFITSPIVPNVAAAGSPSVEEGWDDYVDAPPALTDPEARAGVNVTEALAVMHTSKTHNIFDSTDTDNVTEDDSESPVTGKVVLSTIEAQRIYGTTVRGAVYN